MPERGKAVSRRCTKRDVRDITGQGNEHSSTVAEILVGNRGMVNSKRSVLRWKM